MLRRRISRASAFLATSIVSLLPHVAAKAQESKVSRDLKQSMLTKPSLLTNSAAGGAPGLFPSTRQQVFAWRTNIVTTTFWVGEDAAKNNPVPNHASSWDMNWAKNYGGTDTPDRKARANYIPAKFTPGQNPFYVALPYNDITKGGHKPEASVVIPWFKQAFERNGKSVLKGRWIAIRFRDRICYAQWEDCGPFRTDHWQYVFGTERPKPNLNKGAGLDVSPAVRDFLGMNDTDVTDWKFVEFSEVPTGPWATHGENNTFVQIKRQQQGGTAVASAQKTGAAPDVATPVVGLNGEVFQPIR